MKTGTLAVALAVLIAAGSAQAANWNFPVPPPTPLTPLEAGSTPSAVSLAKVVVQMNPGQQYGVVRTGVLCEEPVSLQWRDTGDGDSVEVYRPIFFKEIAAAGLKTEGDPNNLFEDSSTGADLAVGVVIRNVQANFCSRAPVFSGPDQVSGKLMFDAEWQVYSRLRQQTLAKISTSGGHLVAKGVPDGFAVAFNGAFAEHVRQLIASETFRRVVTAPVTLSGSAAPSSAITFKPADLAKRSIGESASSVVIVFAGDGHGAGFLISRDGFVLTNHHVVGGAKFVKVRWADKSESLGEVVRLDRRRDVALIKVDAGGRKPLALRRGGTSLGEAVFAIGAPLDAKFQNTVTKGIVSANRTYDGLTFIQSDVNINPGNSGGPLLDENGAVLGIAVSRYQIGDAPTGLNLFIPIVDALDTLALKPAT